MLKEKHYLQSRFLALAAIIEAILLFWVMSDKIRIEDVEAEVLEVRKS